MIAEIPAKHFATTRTASGRFLCIQRGAELVVVRDSCKHRGGPLSLGTWCERSGSITCPWHDIVNGPKDLARRELPSVQVGERLRFVHDPLDDEQESPAPPQKTSPTLR